MPPTWATSQAHVKQPEKSPPSGSEAAPAPGSIGNTRNITSAHPDGLPRSPGPRAHAANAKPGALSPPFRRTHESKWLLWQKASNAIKVQRNIQGHPHR
ncbi:unnamed protein product [Boreogadus saida]